MKSMFNGAFHLIGDIGDWDVSSVVNMKLMFNGASSFNGDNFKMGCIKCI